MCSNSWSVGRQENCGRQRAIHLWSWAACTRDTRLQFVVATQSRHGRGALVIGERVMPLSVSERRTVSTRSAKSDKVGALEVLIGARFCDILLFHFLVG